MEPRRRRAKDQEGLNLKVSVLAFPKAQKDQQLLPAQWPLQDFELELEVEGRNRTNDPNLKLAISHSIGRCCCFNGEESLSGK